MASALCAQTDPDAFTPTTGDPIAAAKRICRGCPVRSECLDHALVTHAEGIWGGTSALERRRMRAHQRQRHQAGQG